MLHVTFKNKKFDFDFSTKKIYIDGNLCLKVDGQQVYILKNSGILFYKNGVDFPEPSFFKIGREQHGVNVDSCHYFVRFLGWDKDYSLDFIFQYKVWFKLRDIGLQWCHVYDEVFELKNLPWNALWLTSQENTEQFEFEQNLPKKNVDIIYVDNLE